MSIFRKALMITAIPIVTLSLISMAGAGEYMGQGFQMVWVVAAGMFMGALVAAIVLSIMHKREIAGGSWAGIGIGIVALGDDANKQILLMRLISWAQA